MSDQGCMEILFYVSSSHISQAGTMPELYLTYSYVSPALTMFIVDDVPCRQICSTNMIKLAKKKKNDPPLKQEWK